MRIAPFLLAGLLPLSAPVLAHSDHAHEHHSGASLGAHQHGVAQLNLVVEGERIEIELDSPADNLVGFEHLPTRDEDRARVRSVHTRMQDASNLFRFPAAAECSLQQADLKSPLFDALENDPAGTPSDQGHQHADTAHHDIEAHYRFRCAAPAALTRIEVVLFEHFPGTERLVLQAIGEAGQQGGELTRAQNVIRF